MKVNTLEEYLLKIYKAGNADRGRVSVLLLGAPGIGKSFTCRALAMKIAAYLGKKFVDYTDIMAPIILNNPDEYFVFIDFRLTECEPSDLLGIPQQTNGAVRFAPLLWAKVLSMTAGLLLLDELTNVQRPDIITASYKLIFDRKAGFTKFHDDVMIVCCGNRPEESSVATMLPTPLINRMLVLTVDPPTIDGWNDWMNITHGKDYDIRSYGFLRRFADENYLIKVPMKAETLEAYPTPRSWTMTSLLMQQNIDTDDTLIGLLGLEVGTKLGAFLKTDIDLDEVINNPTMFTSYDLDGQYMVSVMLGSWLGSHGSKKSFPLIDVMCNASREFLVLTCMSMSVKKKLVTFLREIFTHKPEYKDILNEIAITLKEEIKSDTSLFHQTQ